MVLWKQVRGSGQSTVVIIFVGICCLKRIPSLIDFRIDDLPRYATKLDVSIRPSYFGGIGRRIRVSLITAVNVVNLLPRGQVVFPLVRDNLSRPVPLAQRQGPALLRLSLTRGY